MREAQSAANLSHPNIVTVYDFGRDGDRQYIVMEYVEAKTSSGHRGEAPLPVARALDIAAQVCAGVGGRTSGRSRPLRRETSKRDPDAGWACQSHGLWHRARLYGHCAGRIHGKRVGTPHYFSPEQAAGRAAHPRLRCL